MNSALIDLLEKTKASRAAIRRPAVIFDLDDTLLSTANRHLRILREFAGGRLESMRGAGSLQINDALAEAKANSVFRSAWVLSQVEAPQLRYSIKDTARSVGVTAPEVLEELHDFWFERFFRNDYLREDEPLPGAAEYCRALLEAGAVLAYVTGRDEAMREGTEDALHRHGFPMPDGRRTHLVLKPRFDMPDFEYKSEALRRCASLGEVLGAFENEPAHANLLREIFPSALVGLLRTKHSGKPVTLHADVAIIDGFPR